MECREQKYLWDWSSIKKKITQLQILLLLILNIIEIPWIYDSENSFLWWIWYYNYKSNFLNRVNDFHTYIWYDALLDMHSNSRQTHGTKRSNDVRNKLTHIQCNCTCTSKFGYLILTNVHVHFVFILCSFVSFTFSMYRYIL